MEDEFHCLHGTGIYFSKLWNCIDIFLLYVRLHVAGHETWLVEVLNKNSLEVKFISGLFMMIWCLVFSGEGCSRRVESSSLSAWSIWSCESPHWSCSSESLLLYQCVQKTRVRDFYSWILIKWLEHKLLIDWPKKLICNCHNNWLICKVNIFGFWTGPL